MLGGSGKRWIDGQWLILDGPVLVRSLDCIQEGELLLDPGQRQGKQLRNH